MLQCTPVIRSWRITSKTAGLVRSHGAGQFHNVRFQSTKVNATKEQGKALERSDRWSRLMLIGFKYPRRLLIYHTGNFETATMGMSKLLPVFFFFYGTLAVAPMVVFSPDYSSWLAPLSKIASSCFTNRG